MESDLIIHGRIANQTFVPDGPLPDVEAPAELIVRREVSEKGKPGTRSMFEFFGKAPRLRSAEDIDAQLREEREAWNEP
jgi:hypothetical protein